MFIIIDGRETCFCPYTYIYLVISYSIISVKRGLRIVGGGKVECWRWLPFLRPLFSLFYVPLFSLLNVT
jgi:hypothetical protein